MDKITQQAGFHGAPAALVTMLEEQDRIIVDQVVLGDVPGHLIDGHPWSTTLVRRLEERIVVRDYLATFAATEDSARRVLRVSLALARMVERQGAAGASALGVAAWCAMALGRWELADALAIESEHAAPNGLAELIRKGIAGRWICEVLGVEKDYDVEDVRRCSARTLRLLTEPRACLKGRSDR